jgi:hypothetical protein
MALSGQDGADVVRQGKHGDENGFTWSVVGEHKDVLSISAGIAVGIIAGQVAEEIPQFLVGRVGADAEVEDPIQHAQKSAAIPSGAFSGALVGMSRSGKLDH